METSADSLRSVRECRRGARHDLTTASLQAMLQVWPRYGTLVGRSSEVAKPKRDAGGEVFRVLPRQVDQTIAAALRQWLPGKSWSQVRRLFKARQVILNGNLCEEPGYRLRLVDVVKLLPHSLAPPAREEDVRIRYLDKHIAVVEKPAGMTSTRHADERQLSPRQRQLQPTLAELLPRLIAQREGCRGKAAARRVRPVHRLDRETSGLMVFARTAQAEKHLGHQFRVHSIRRRYVAIADGRRGRTDHRKPIGPRSRRRPARQHQACPTPASAP